MVFEKLKDIEESIKNFYQGFKDRLKETSISFVNEADERFNEVIAKSKVFLEENYSMVKEDTSDAFQSSLENIYFYDAWQYRNNFIRERAIAERVNMVLAANIPVFLFSSGLRRIKNPIVFTAFASILILPELINPFNRN